MAKKAVKLSFVCILSGRRIR